MPWDNMHRMAEHCLSDHCRENMKAQWKLKNEAVKNRITLWLPTKGNVVKLINEYHAPLEKLLVDSDKTTNKTEKAKVKQKAFSFFPERADINNTLRANGKEELSEADYRQLYENRSKASDPGPSSVPAASDPGRSSVPAASDPGSSSVPAASDPGRSSVPVLELTRFSSSAAVPVPTLIPAPPSRIRRKPDKDSSGAADPIPRKRRNADKTIPRNVENLMKKNKIAELHTFINETVELNDGSFVKDLKAQQFKEEFMREGAQNFVYRIKDPYALRGLKNTVPKETLQLGFRDCVRQMFVEDEMERETFKVRSYDADGHEKIETMDMRQFTDSLEGPDPLNVIDFFPPGK